MKQIRTEFIIDRSGKQFVLYTGLVDAAHAEGIKSIDTELLQKPAPDNGEVAIVKAVVEMEDGRRFSGIGDASPRNVSKNIAPHTIRMAETRAKARALRDALNVSAAALEELGGEDDTPPARDTARGNVAPLRANGTLDAEAQDRFKARIVALGVDPDIFEAENGPIAALNMAGAKHHIKRLQGEG